METFIQWILRGSCSAIDPEKNEDKNGGIATMEKKEKRKVLSGIAGALCAISVFLPWFMHTNDVHPYTVLEMTSLRDYFNIASGLERMFATLTWISVVGVIGSALIMFLFAFQKKRFSSIVVIGIPALSILLLIISSIMLFEYGFFPVFGPVAVLIAAVLHFISVSKTPKNDSFS